MPGDDLALLRMPDIELLGIIRVICEAIDERTTGKKFDSQTKHVAGSQNCKTNKDQKVKLHEGNSNKDKTNTPDYLISSRIKIFYFNPSDNKEADKRASEAITNRIHNEFINLFSGTDCFKGKLSLQVEEGSHLYPAPPTGSGLCFTKATERRAGAATETKNHCPIRC